jgi:hypothetical protein
MDRATLLAAVDRRLGDRQLVWFGTRGDDVESLAEVPALAAAYSIVNRYRRRSQITGLALEDLTGVRVDLDTYDLDAEVGTDEVAELRGELLRTLSRPTAIVAYRPSAFLSAVCFARHDRCDHLGLFNDHQSAFEHKPWLETAISELGLPHIPWTYVADEDQLDTMRFLQEGSVMLRASRTTGGVGLTKVDDLAEVEARWPEERDGFVSVAPFLEGGVPLNVSGVVWHDGVTVHPLSQQLVGIPGLTTRPFGYCGNDFAAARELDPAVVAQIDDSVVAIGGWLGRHGYRGAFGIDYLLVEGVPLFTEVNPRLQGSTHASCQLAVEADESCLLLEHLAAHLGLDAPRRWPLANQVATLPPLAHLIVHWGGRQPARLSPDRLAATLLEEAGPGGRVDVATEADLLTEPDATVLRLTARSGVLDGIDLDARWRRALHDGLRHGLDHDLDLSSAAPAELSLEGTT